MNFHKKFLFLLLISTTGVMPASLHAQVGSSGLSFLKLGVSGRGVSMGDAMSALVTGAEATYYNPSGVYNKDATSTQIVLMHKEWIQDVRSEFLGTSVQLNDESAFGFSVNTATVSDIEVRTRPGTAEGTFTSRDLSAGLTYARTIMDDVSVGLTAKFLYEKIFVDESNGIAFDLGARYKTPVENLNLGLAISNLGSMNGLRHDSIILPSLLRIGPAYSTELESITSQLVLATDLLYIFPEKKSYLNIGGELLFNKVIAARAGYQAGSSARGFSAGVGVRYGMFSLDYGFVPLSADLGSGHTFSLGLNL